ncbi:hypothetical protein GNI_020380 [Gregarina niphandrodes]|uniref:Uncharacterized protein n=1 Tax=Gregarina niphandrodes TaxID=110365 RepID=A0A023BBT3_GRENI|nr:hypothetical protein GNI_020380 [Gregarina niphandrodes]EZG81036.1 hypothetical protein GNI_020380 [Gregarina niphandrodes]|eukprot:XP_011134275.1 hypothetical protein GNI_020380 [Gregarina niphandrodes]
MYNLKEDVYYAEAWQRHLHICEFIVVSRLGFNLKPLIRENPLLYLEAVCRELPEQCSVDLTTSYGRCLNLMAMPLSGVWLSARSVAFLAALDPNRVDLKTVLLQACPKCPTTFIDLISDKNIQG